MLQCCVRLSVCLAVCLSSVTLGIVAKRCILEQKLLLRAYRKSYITNTKMNDLDLYLEVVSRSCQPLRCIWQLKLLEIEAWFQKTTNRKWHMGYRMVTWPMTSRDLERSNLWPQYTYSAISRKRLDLKTPFQRTANRKCHMGYQIVTWPMTSRETRRCSEAVRSAILATAWLLVKSCCSIMNCIFDGAVFSCLAFSVPPFAPDWKLISFTNPFLHSHSYSFRTAFTDLKLYCIKGHWRLFVLVFFLLRVLDKAEYSAF